ILFGVSHGNLVQGTYAFVLGVIFGIVYLYTNNLWITILLHMGINSSSVLFTFMPIYINVMICIFAIIITIEFLYRQYKKVPHNIWKLIWL
ncbi:CPBP family intramembrane glutamic endopeptidase, partial [Klebsiella variicola]|uniref:CPBP family intramembrane glutamic endopeptidase n=1 Tax=Klebsiella variicola TaxID=244366 RepID=UPI002730D8FA